MPAHALPMRTIREILRLGLTTTLSDRQIARSVNVSRSTVGAYLNRARELKWCWPLQADYDEADLRTLLRNDETTRIAASERRLPQWTQIHQEMQRRGVTLHLLWEEYRKEHADGYGYSRFCELYRSWAGSIEVVMRQHHTPGERLFVDYAGMTMPVVDGLTGEIRQVQIFVACLGASNYFYAEATETQTIRDWVSSHVRALTFFGGVPQIVVPDNLKSGVTRACWYDPDINRTYVECAEHYGFAVLPTRVKKPRDKSKVEKAV